MQTITNKFIKGYDKNDTYYEYHLDKKNIPTIFIHGVGLVSSAWCNLKIYFYKTLLKQFNVIKLIFILVNYQSFII